jgi:hypothetical protein
MPAYLAAVTRGRPRSSTIIVPPIARTPLSTDYPTNCQDVLPWTPPHERAYMRGDAWGVTVPGLPYLPGKTAIEHPERCLTWFFDCWSPDWHDPILRAHCERSYTHFVLSAPTSLNTIEHGGAGKTIEQLVETCQLVKRYKPRDAAEPLDVVMFLGAKHPYSLPPSHHDMSTSEWIAYVDPLLDALLPYIDECVPAWEWDLWNIPSNAGGPSIDVPKHIGRRAHDAGVSCWMHFSPHRTAWFEDGSDRYVWWDQLGDDVDGLMFQGDPYWTADELQARIVDTLKQFGTQGNRHKLRMFETLAIRQFTGDPPGSDHPNEDDVNLQDFLACCTTDVVEHTDAKVWGYGNGGRQRSGSPL